MNMHLHNTNPRAAFRTYALDGALLHFHPETGTSIRLENAMTQALQRQAPRVAMFGITNVCNLQCAFCSRDSARPSLWTVETASAMLQGLSHAGTLEVAFGGGEPLAFRGFAELIAELYAATPLALNVTTNGTAAFHPVLAECAGRLGQVRLSLYDDVPWRDTAHLLSRLGQRWGANLLVDDNVLPWLPQRLAELARLGCHDVSLLSYIGHDPSRHLSAAGRRALAAIIADAPLAVRISVCFGAQLGIPRLFAGADDSGDCGAGLDFITLTPDGYVQSCSFQEHRLPALTADAVLEIWRNRRDELKRDSPRLGCHRQQGAAQHPRDHAPVMLWQAFSGNNSGECVMVARFETAQDAQAYLDQLLPAYEPGVVLPEAWLTLFREARFPVPDNTWLTLFREARLRAPDNTMQELETPEELLAVGRVVMATSYGYNDAFAPLRALAWKRNAYLPMDGVHLHGDIGLLAAIRARDRADAHALRATLSHPAATVHLDGERLLILFNLDDRAHSLSLTQASDLLKQSAGTRPLSAEVLELPSADDYTHILQQRGAAIAQEPRLVVYFSSSYDEEENKQRFAHFISLLNDGERVTVAGKAVLISNLECKRKRLAVLAYRHGGTVCAFESTRLKIFAQFRPAKDKVIQNTWKDAQARETLRRGLRDALPDSTLEEVYYLENVHLETQDPHAVLATLRDIANAQQLNLAVSLHDPNYAALALRRVLEDVMRRDATP